MITLSKAFEIVDNIAAKTNLSLAKEIIPTIAAVGRVVTEDQRSLLDLPPFNKSAMDGFSVLSEDNYNNLRHIETVAAGKFPNCELKKGTTIKVMTGSPVPNGAAKVIPIENVKCNGDHIAVLDLPKVDHICQQGEDIHKGEVILPAFSLLDELAVVNLISCGIKSVKVLQRSRVAILTTGDEVVDSIEQSSAGKIIDSNGPMLNLLAKKHELEVVYQKHVSDQKEMLLQTLHEAMEKADIILLTGGVSVGDFDYVKEVLLEVGCEIHFDSVAIKPGKPVAFASVKDKIIFGLPGNPVAVFLLFHLLILSFIRKVVINQNVTTFFEGCLAEDFLRRNIEREEFVPAKFIVDGKLQRLDYHGSAHLLGLMHCDVFFTVPIGVGKISKDEKVRFLQV